MFSLLSVDVMTWCTLALGCIVLGLLGLFVCTGSSPKSRVYLELGLLLIPGVAGGVAWVCGAEPILWVPCLGVTGLGLGLASLRLLSFVNLARLVQLTLGHPAMPWVGLSLLGVGALVAQQRDLESQLVSDGLLDVIDTVSAEHLLESVETQWAVTDEGNSVPLFTIPEDKATLSPDHDETFLNRQHLGLAMIRTGELNMSYNCHGFVFTGGKYWVRGGSVETILKDNGYVSTSSPRPGDVVVYRDQETGQVSHTGIVRTVVDEVVLIESKLGSLGRFIHPSDKHPYPNTSVTYYHTRRGAHVLNGLDGMRRPQADTLATD